MSSFPFYRQLDAMDCGPTCLRMISKYYGKTYSLDTLRNATRYSREGVSMLGISKAAETIGFRTLGAIITIDKLISDETLLPCIAHWDQNHFVVIHKISKNKVYVADPGKEKIAYRREEFLEHWANIQKGESKGAVMLLEPTINFYQQEEEEHYPSIDLFKLYRYALTYKALIFQLVLGLLLGSLLQLIFPFLTKAIVDIGINHRNIDFIYLVLAGQLMLTLGQTSLDLIRGWIFLHVGTKIKLSILSEFLAKLLKLPLSFFDTRMAGDIIQRISDHHRIEAFLTNNTLSTLFSIVNMIVFGIVLCVYNTSIFVVFLMGSAIYILWAIMFLRFRKKLDYQRFQVASRNQSQLIEFISGIHEIKLNDCGVQKLWEWERIQAKFFRLSSRSLALSQNQQLGGFFINQGKNIVSIFLAARAVMYGELSLGEMLAIQYIIGQLNSPVEQLLQFMQTTQDAKLSLERMNDIYVMPNEEPAERAFLTYLPSNKSITLQNLSFTYPGTGNKPILKNVNIHIPEGKITAIVGASGSGKTTLLKLLLKMYETQTGEVRVGDLRLDALSHQFWRKQCGTVMQDGYIFSDTIARNIAVGDEQIDTIRLEHAVRVANIYSFIEDAPLGYNTKVGSLGNGISQGQKQRLLIARAVYKNPEYIFFDEATSALDASNERVIMENLNYFFKGRTVVVVAHRLSTVRNADQIIVLNHGEVVEEGTHDTLVGGKGMYYQLVKNQLELGN
ncbi:peptidase domain-containing ABC transporter [Cytophagaceae bacterium YF14B1]|uniref:Peptidase domain-containing ABC transporter n=1 Tax=Xanthocytophaga flava TaxID=3048013 RepID=A0AAE3QUA5_9BACT|nr:peptidase domain-containing ABC transporter [Xanthocytophaga flavus]MDJ1485595.1 peptidase domain-containing ABC transporter [Xanthocytophaga flavus]